MNEEIQLSLLFPDIQPGQLQECTADYSGLRYKGQFTVAPHWDPAWGQRLEEDAYFRIVFLTAPQRATSFLLQDPRITVSIPGRAPARRKASLEREFRAVGEALRLYVTMRETSAAPLRRSLEGRQEELRRDLAAEEARSYYYGRVVTQGDLALHPREVFHTGTYRDWCQALAQHLLAAAYPHLPWDPASLPRPLAREEVVHLYEGLIGARLQEEPVRSALLAFSVPLGLAAPTEPLRLALQSNAVYDVIQRALQSSRGAADARDLLHHLAHERGLTLPLATLYLMSYLLAGPQEVEIHLRPGHRLKTASGYPFPGDRLFKEALPEIPWEDRWWEDLLTVAEPSPPTWQTLAPYAKAFLPGVPNGLPQADPSAIAQLLSHALAQVREQLPAVRQSLQTLSDTLGHTLAQTGQEALERLEGAASATNPSQLFPLCRRIGPPSALAQVLDLHRRLLQLSEKVQEIRMVKECLDGAALGPRQQDMAFEKATILAQLDVNSLVQNPSLWPTVKGHFETLYSRYREAYAYHHTAYNRQARTLARRLEQMRPRLEALDRLNTLLELGPPVRPDLSPWYRGLQGSLKLCTAPPPEGYQEPQPFCPNCHLTLLDTVPEEETSLLEEALRDALAQQNHRLASYTTHRILDTPGRDLTDKFIQIVQASDLDSLAGVLDDEVLAFLRSYLRQGRP
ncbi:MAG: hypothetical protein HYU29_08030 [Chloroflexi bacterium]|nr:hypothetical protein [Chloroflexota bacterium]